MSINRNVLFLIISAVAAPCSATTSYQAKEQLDSLQIDVGLIGRRSREMGPDGPG